MLFWKMSVLIYCPTHSVQGFRFLHTLLATDSVFAFVFTVAIPHGARSQLVVVWVCFFLGMTDLEQFFSMCPFGYFCLVLRTACLNVSLFSCFSLT